MPINMFQFMNINETFESSKNTVVSAFSIPTLSHKTRKNGAPPVSVVPASSKPGPPANDHPCNDGSVHGPIALETAIRNFLSHNFCFDVVHNKAAIR